MDQNGHRGGGSVHPDTPTLTRHLLGTLSNRTDVNGPELFRYDLLCFKFFDKLVNVVCPHLSMSLVLQRMP